MKSKKISLRVTPEIDSIIDWLHIQLCCSREEAVRRCILYCSTCPKKIVEYLFNQVLSTQEV